MRKYYLFIVQAKVAEVYENDLKDLYTSLYGLYKGRFNNLNYRISLFEQICVPFKVDLINNYFKRLLYVKKHNNKYLYNKRILVCDFANHDYFWLSKQNTKIKSFEYN